MVTIVAGLWSSIIWIFINQLKKLESPFIYIFIFGMIIYTGAIGFCIADRELRPKIQHVKLNDKEYIVVINERFVGYKTYLSNGEIIEADSFDKLLKIYNSYKK
jgi:hypothetical protein